MIRKVILFLAIPCFMAAVSYAAEFTGTPTKYQVTIKKAELFNSTTSEWIVAGNSTLSFDIASVSAGATVAGYASGAALTPGVYTQMRVTVSRTFTIAGSADDGGTTYYTTGGTDTVINSAIGSGAQVIDASTTAGDLADGTVVIPTTGLTLDSDTSFFVETFTLSSSFTVTEGTTNSATVSFDVSGKLVGNTDTVGRPYFIINAPSVSISVS